MSPAVFVAMQICASIYVLRVIIAKAPEFLLAPLIVAITVYTVVVCGLMLDAGA